MRANRNIGYIIDDLRVANIINLLAIKLLSLNIVNCPK